MRVLRDARFDAERAQLALRHCCEDCGLFREDTQACAHEWPTAGHRRRDYEQPVGPEKSARAPGDPPAEPPVSIEPVETMIDFCKEFELA